MTVPLSLPIDQSRIQILREHVALEKQAKQRGSRPEIIRLSGEFHVKMTDVSGNALLTRIVKELVTRTSLIVGLFGAGRGTSCREDEHDEILNAIERGDRSAAKQLTIEHLTHIQDGLELVRTPKKTSSLVKILSSKEKS
ncbi:FCD domain-containing protein [Pseudophaeobacter sp. EL27]|uniref:FCD domain-containing protein n=1 Tax=Pseudophaeobacter sp. EL27 TaxID=2107580 RepID=UPI0013C4DDF1|nr:FCD domain-containing protein [Pseudophaeobacter sp. EL27]